MHILIQESDTFKEPTIIEIKRVYTRGCANDYGLKSKEYIYFQFDGSDRPHDFKDEYKEEQWFNGYLIGKKKDGYNQVTECRIQVKEENI